MSTRRAFFLRSDLISKLLTGHMNKVRGSGLFRQEALEHQKQHRLVGEIVLVQPLPFTLFMWLAIIAALIVVGVLTFSTYTRKATVSGQLVPNAGLVRMTAPEAAVISKQLFTEGARIQKGQTLFELSLERMGRADRSTQAESSRQITARMASLREELGKMDLVAKEEESAALKRRDRLADEIKQARQEAGLAQQRAAISASAVERYKDLQRQNFIPELQVREKQQVLLEHQIAYQTLQRTISTAQRDFEEAQSTLTNLPLKQSAQKLAVERSLALAEQELAEVEGRRQITIVSPVEGVATASMASVGTSVQVGMPLVSIVPHGAQLQAELMAGSQAVGLIKQGQQVALRYSAFPHQHYGRYTGQVASVSKAPVMAGGGAGADQNNTANPLYRVLVTLDSQSVRSKDRELALAPGMTVEADLMLETRSLGAWLAEPLHTLRAMVASR
jgi:membrane fusion protein